MTISPSASARIGSLENRDASGALVTATGRTVGRSIADRLADRPVIFDFISDTSHAAIIAGTSDYDCAAALGSMLSEGGGMAPEGTYRLGSTVVFPNDSVGTELYGAGIGKTVFRPLHNGVGIKSLGAGLQVGNHGLNLSGFTINGLDDDGVTKRGSIGLHLDVTYHSHIADIMVREMGSDGILLERGFYNTLINCWGRKNAGNGIHLGRTANANTIVGGHAEHNGGVGLLIFSNGDPVRPHGNVIIGITCESNGIFNVELHDTDANMLLGAYCESVAEDGTTYHIVVKSNYHDTSGDTSNWNTIIGAELVGTPFGFLVENAKQTKFLNVNSPTDCFVQSSAISTSLIGLHFRGGSLADSSTTTFRLQKGGTVAELNQTISPTYVQSEVQDLSNKVDELIGALSAAGVISA